MNEESQNHRIDSELEARVVAYLLGEASDLERDALHEMLEQRPELAAIKAKLESVHDLMREVATGEHPAMVEGWRLSAAKRTAVLAVINSEAGPQPALTLVAAPSGGNRPLSFAKLRSVVRIAAVFCVVGLLGALALSKLSLRSRRLFVASDEMTATKGVESLADKSTRYYLDIGGEMPIEGTRAARAKAVAATVPDFEQDSKAALSAIRGHLFSGPDSTNAGFKPPGVANEQVPARPESRFSREDVSLWQANVNASDIDLPLKENTVPDSVALNGLGSTLPQAIRRYHVSDTESSKAPILSEAQLSDLASSSQAVDPSSESRPNGRLNGAASYEDHAKFMGDTVLGNPDPEAWQHLGRDDAPMNGKNLWMEPGTARPRETKGLESASESRSNFESQLSGRQQPLSQATPSSSGGTEAAGRSERSRDGRNSDGRNSDGGYGGGGYGGGGYGGGGYGGGYGGGVGGGVGDGYGGALGGVEYGDGPGSQTAGKGQKSSTIAEQEFGVGRERKEQQQGVPEKPQIAGKGYRAKELAEAAGVVAGFDVSSPSTLQTPSANQPISGREELRTLNDLAQTVRNEAEIARQQTPMTNGIPANQDNPSKEKAGLGWSIEKEQQLGEVQAFGENPANRWRSKKEEGDRPKVSRSARTDANGNGVPDDFGNDRDLKLMVTPRILIQEEKEIAQDHFVHAEPGRVALGRKAETEKPALVKKSIAPMGLNETRAADDAFSTFSLHVSDVSFKLALSALARGEWPEAAKVRIEEFVNAMDYGDPLPKHGERVACRVEQSIHPFLQQRNLLRVSMRTSAAGRSSNTPLRLTFLLDNSGSMERIDRQQTVRRAFALLARQLQPIDQVTLISFARQPRLLADKVSGAQAKQLVQLIENLPSEGGTNLEAAMHLAFEKAKEQQTEGAQNRIVLLTDGAVNLGDANPESLARTVTAMRDAGIAFDAGGISAEGLNDEVMEALTRKGDGRYYLLDSVEAADDGFARQIAGALRPSAKNVKVQVEFNPRRVGCYKLLGFEKHLLKQEDFRNDQVDAAEMAAAEAGVAVYQFEANPDGEGDVGSVSVRFRDLRTGEMVENRWPIPYEADASRAEQAAPSMRMATCAALFAAKLRGEPLGETVDLKSLSELLSALPEPHRSAKRNQQLQLMIEQARQVHGK